MSNERSRPSGAPTRSDPTSGVPTGVARASGAPTGSDLATSGQPARRRSRRDVLAVAGLGVVGGGLLAACGGTSGSSLSSGASTTAGGADASSGSPGSASSAPSASDAVPSTSAPPSTSAAGPSSAAASPSGGASSGGFSVPTSQIPVGGGKIFDKQELVVTQPTSGEFKAFSAVCPHQGCIVAQIDNKKIICPCHASMFDLATGAVLSGPAQTGLTPEQASVAGSTVTVA